MWCNEDECLKKIRDYDEHKKNVIVNFFNILGIKNNVVTLE